MNESHHTHECVKSAYSTMSGPVSSQHSLHCNKLQHLPTHCNTYQHTATPTNTLQHPATPCNTLQCPDPSRPHTPPPVHVCLCVHICTPHACAYDMTRSYVSRDSSPDQPVIVECVLCVSVHVQTHASVTGLIQMCNVTDSYVQHDSSPGPCLIPPLLHPYTYESSHTYELGHIKRVREN